MQESSRIGGKEALALFSTVAPLINEVLTTDIGISVWERDTCVIYIAAANLDFGIKAGDKMKSGSAGEIAMREKRRVLVEMSKEKSPWGIPYIVNATPILDANREPVGCVITTERSDKQEKVRATSTNLRTSSEQLSETLVGLSLRAEAVAASGASLKTSMDLMSVKINETGKIIAAISSIAGNTNILGLNAAIEAARVGDVGRGFSVVANEVRKLAHMSAEATNQIRLVIASIEQAFEKSKQETDKVSGIVKEQLAMIQEVTSAGEELSQMAQQLHEITKDIALVK
jgi:hypothetical protein